MPLVEYYYLLVETDKKGNVNVGRLQKPSVSFSILCDKAREQSREHESIVQVYKLTIVSPGYTKLCYTFLNGRLVYA